jgi:hypothetical protein
LLVRAQVGDGLRSPSVLLPRRRDVFRIAAEEETVGGVVPRGRESIDDVAWDRLA